MQEKQQAAGQSHTPQYPAISALLYFEAAARSGSFTAGARAMNLSQSAFSRQIQSLQVQTGQTLFKRARQRLQMTDAGAKC
ncbi:hypothetical protein RA19_04865 [Leisingera sp. ANG-M1]|uniref:helix-turn-helix domain-containing protein n=1 Tax=Leisingera sp. ANG-M1 TaxID=1577895 RepID=UPI00057F7191|nr:LysR family transcriptional regulator [Leisingera sp. ANG-M1]KIC11958.1 hypothetical protein RA19_04865 [Leisingera sp. ANG-M1]